MTISHHGSVPNVSRGGASASPAEPRTCEPSTFELRTCAPTTFELSTCAPRTFELNPAELSTCEPGAVEPGTGESRTVELRVRAVARIMPPHLPRGWRPPRPR